MNSFGCCPYSWQEGMWMQLLSALERRLLSHAYLILGPAGIGKRDFCSAFASFLLCSDRKQSSHQACGNCSTCRLSQAGTHPDLLWIDVEAEDSNSEQIKIDQIRQVVTFTNKTAQQGGYRIVVLNTAQSLNTSAANALLKKLEEPGEDTIIFLINQSLQGVLPTLRSRCQSLSLPTPSLHVARQWLCNNAADVNEEEMQMLLYLTGGAPLAAQLLMQQDKLGQIRDMLQAWALLSKGKKSVTEVAQLWQEIEPQLLVSWMMRWLSAMIKYCATGNEDYLPPLSVSAMLKYVAQKVSYDRLVLFYGWLAEQRRMLSGQINLNIQLLVEAMLARWLSLVL